MDHSASKIGAIRGEKTGLVTTQIEWIELVGGLPEQDSLFLRDLIGRHREQFVGVFYDRLMSNRDAATFLSQKMVQERLHNSLSDWLLKMFERTPAMLTHSSVSSARSAKSTPASTYRSMSSCRARACSRTRSSVS